MSKEKTIKMRQDRLKKILLEQMRRTPTVEQSCQKSGVSRMTVYRWMKASKRFADEAETALREGREFVSDIAEAQMFSLINQGKTEMIKFFLTHNNARYANKLELSGAVSNKEDVLTKEQKALVRQALKFSSFRNYGKRTGKA